MDEDRLLPRMAALLRELRTERGISLRQLADEAKVSVSVVSAAERGRDAQLTTWEKLFGGLGYLVTFDYIEMCEEAADLLAEEQERRRERQVEGLCTGKRRFFR